MSSCGHILLRKKFKDEVVIITNNNILFAFLMTLLAGLSTGIGSLTALFSGRRGPRFLCLCMGFSAGVMIYVSLGEILLKGRSYLTSALGERAGYFVMLAAFFGGMGLLALLNKILPESGESGAGGDMKKAGLVTALAIALHNLPEGMATFMAALSDPSIALPVVVAIAVHNIPEGISVALPLAYGGMGKRKAFLLSLASGLTEPLGAVVGYLLLTPFMSDGVYGAVFSAVAGIMTYISLDELLPAAEREGSHGLALVGVVSGMGIMGVSVGLFL